MNNKRINAQDAKDTMALIIGKIVGKFARFSQKIDESLAPLFGIGI